MKNYRKILRGLIGIAGNQRTQMLPGPTETLALSVSKILPEMR